MRPERGKREVVGRRWWPGWPPMDPRFQQVCCRFVCVCPNRKHSCLGRSSALAQATTITNSATHRCSGCCKFPCAGCTGPRVGVPTRPEGSIPGTLRTRDQGTNRRTRLGRRSRQRPSRRGRTGSQSPGTGRDRKNNR